MTYSRVPCCWVRSTLVLDQETLREESTGLFTDALWTPIWEFSIWLMFRKSRKGDSWTATLLCSRLGPKSQWNLKALSTSVKSLVFPQRCQEALMQSWWGVQDQQHPIFMSCYSTCSATEMQTPCSERNKALRKPRRELKNMLTFWPREWRKPKRNKDCQETGCLPWELLLLLLKNYFISNSVYVCLPVCGYVNMI